ncbi:MAG: FkbM family methyltransferase [Acidobacteriia bacterium]|nr:FkbM family methyltransferase [Terriglobia bacterium]
MEIAAILVGLALIAVLALAARRLSMLERKADEAAAQRAAELEAERRRSVALEAEIAGLVNKTEEILARHSATLNDAIAVIGGRMDAAERQAADLRELVRSQVESARADALETRSALAKASSEIGELSGRALAIEDRLEFLARMPARNFPIDERRFEAATEAEMVGVAESVTAAARPLVPYPRWRFDADWANPDLAFQLRQRLWQLFHDRRWETPVSVGWHDGTRLGLYLGNDLSRQIYIAGCFDPNEFAFLDRLLRPGMVFLDIGANEGVYTVFAARRLGSGGLVWAFEPSTRELERLRRNLELNHLDVRVFPLALAEEPGRAALAIAGYEHEGQNTLGDFVYAGIETAGRETVELARLDDIVRDNALARLDAIKIDAEGAELRVLKGAAATLRRYRPVLLFEASDASLRKQGASRDELCGYLQAQNYDLYAFDRHSGLPAPAQPGLYSDNMIAWPAGEPVPETIYRPWPDRL